MPTSLISCLRYLSLVLGRPTTLNEDDITRPYPDLAVGPEEESDQEETSLMPGVVAHAKCEDPKPPPCVKDTKMFPQVD